MKYTITVLLCSLAPSLWAQEQIKGQVVDEKNQPIWNASVYWEHSSIGITTDQKGQFSLPLNASHQTLKISFVGYKEQTITIDQQRELRIQLTPDTQMEEVVVHTKQRNTQRSIKGTSNTITMNSGELLKAACCNISEAFETNPAIDVNFSDAITGTKQIKMLGLSSPYILIAEENIPSVRGASQAYGLTFTPGTWVESIQVTKGAGSVVNGFESISGQINTELIKPMNDRPLFVNLYGSSEGRFEANVHANTQVSEKWTSSLFLHGNARKTKNDMNDDGFLDNPLGEQINVMNRWQYTDLEKGWISFLTWRYMKDNKQSGEYDYDKDLHAPGKPIDSSARRLWGSEVNTEKFDVSSKLGYVFPEMPFQSIGLQLSYNYHKQDSYFGANQYDIKHNSIYSNLLFSSIINNTLNKFSTGLSFTLDKYDEQIALPTAAAYQRIDNSAGAFFEYTYDNTDNFSFVTGLRFDVHNRMGAFFTPRFHLRYNPWEDAVIRASAGRGKRIANIFAENQNLFASNREFIITQAGGTIYGLDPEIAWNYGLSLSQGFSLFDRKGDLTVDFYRTDFENQIVVDIDQSAHQVNFYNLDGKSYANSLQLDLNYNLARSFNLRAAYKYYDIQTDFKSGKQERPLQAKHRFFANLEYETALNAQQGQWKFDFTYNWMGKQRLPDTSANRPENRLRPYSNPFSTMNAQITKVFNERFEIYIGGENIGNYKQDRVILGANDPFGTDFDSSISYAPIFGQMYYAGLRFKLDRKQQTNL
ncbi:TonB-dependent receptor [Flavobacterium sp. JP2137]|uniref:TonB-dependent receptor n=1 Tax=Flavobacterium sp. JP2137 TaxID=3414510 RepID=UPI003D300E86